SGQQQGNARSRTKAPVNVHPARVSLNADHDRAELRVDSRLWTTQEAVPPEFSFERDTHEQAGEKQNRLVELYVRVAEIEETPALTDVPANVESGPPTTRHRRRGGRLNSHVIRKH